MRGYPLPAFVGGSLELMLPDSQDLPARAAEASVVQRITSAGSGNLCLPVLRELHPPGLEAPSMPEVAVYEYAQGVLRKHEIRASRQGAVMHYERGTHAFQHLPDDSFRLGSLALNAAHYPATRFGAQEIATMLAGWTLNRHQVDYRRMR